MNKEQKIIESLYNVTIDPDKFDVWLNRWMEDFFDLPDDLNIEAGLKTQHELPHLNHNIEGHFERALAILDMIGERENKQPTRQEIVEIDPLPTFITDKNGLILHCNQPATDEVKVEVGQQLISLQFSPVDVKKITTILQELEYAEEKTALGLVQLFKKGEKDAVKFALSKILDSQDGASYLHITALQATWNESIEGTILELYNLTAGELDIVKGLVSGDKLADIANQKDRSINTIRTQCKSLLRKTNLKNQSELIRLFATLQKINLHKNNFDLPAADQPTTGVAAIQQGKYIIRSDNRKLYYEVYGPPNGNPVLFLHGMISGTKMSLNIVQHLWQQNIKLICPHRAGFGFSDVEKRPLYLDHFVEDMTALLDEESVKKCTVFGHMDGGYYAYLLGSKIGNRISKIRNVNACVPIKTNKQLNDASPRQRITAYTALYTPKLLPFILRVGIAQVRKQGVERMMKSLYGESEHDMAVLEDSEIGDIMVDGFQSCFMKGIRSFENDMKCIISGNWSHLIENCAMPIELFHSQQQHVVPIQQVRDMVKDIPKLSLTELEGGQIILFKYPEILFDNL